MARSNNSIEAAVKAVADRWNHDATAESGSAETALYAAVYRTLEWARGRRVWSPDKILDVYLRDLQALKSRGGR